MTAFSDSSGFGWELCDDAPAPGKGILMAAYREDSTEAFTLLVWTEAPLPFALVHLGDGQPALFVPAS